MKNNFKPFFQVERNRIWKALFEVWSWNMFCQTIQKKTFLSLCSQYMILWSRTKWKFWITSNVSELEEVFKASWNKNEAILCIFTAHKKINEWNIIFFYISCEICKLKQTKNIYLMRWSNKFATFCFWIEIVEASHSPLSFHHICEGEGILSNWGWDSGLNVTLTPPLHKI